MQISVVVPTCNRRERLLRLLASLEQSIVPLAEVIVVDSGDQRLDDDGLRLFTRFPILYLNSERSVCVQRNLGIRTASSSWIFLCDDDVEVPSDYLERLTHYADAHPGTGAVSGLFLQKEGETWQGQYPVRSAKWLVWKFIFQLGIWGSIDCTSDGWPIKKIKEYYRRKGNHITRAGWPVITDLSGDSFITPVYTLGACLVRKEWLLQSPFDEVLDRNGIGENYGVAAGFPVTGIHILNQAFVYHHHEPAGRLQRPLTYFRRVLALDYFIRTRRELKHASRLWLIWSLVGNLIESLFAGESRMIRSGWKSIRLIVTGRNPYYLAAKKNERVTEPLF
jgi:glycosyltransferase involved in cell wall biosynthesis